MAFADFCMLFLACAILALVCVLASILQEHRLESATQLADRAPHPSIRRNAAPPRHSSPDVGISAVRVPEEVAPRAASRVRFRPSALPSARSLASSLLPSIPNVPSRTQQTGPSVPPSAPAAGPSTSHALLPAPTAGPSTSRPSLPALVRSTSRGPLPSTAAGPSMSRVSYSASAAGPSTSCAFLPASMAGPSTSRMPLTAVASASNERAALLDSAVGASIPWSPKKGWTTACRVNGVTYHRTEKRMRPRKSLKAGSEEPELIITPYWEPENVAARLIDYPPNLFGNPDLAVGDLFVFHTATQYRLWIYRAGGFWERIEVGYQREDGRFLLVTRVKKEPSWVSRDYFERQANRQAESDSD